jgi:hypothetical protein
MNATSPPRLVPPSELPWARRTVMAVGTAVAMSVWGAEAVRHGHPFDPGPATLFAPLLVSLVLANVNHVGAQIVARGLWWFHLVVGTAGALASHQAAPAALALGAGAALLAARGAGLGATGPSRGPFAPAAFRRPLLVSLAMSVAEVQTLAVGAVLLPAGAGGRWLAAGVALLAAAVVGLYRLRAWGVVLHLFATAFVARCAYVTAVATFGSPAWLVAGIWLGLVAVQLAVPMPMVWAIVRRRPVAPPSTGPTAPRLFAALVLALMLAAACGALAPHVPAAAAG